MFKHLVTYKILCVLRVVLTLIPQFGYIHPDEYFQGPEIVYGDIAEYNVLRTWEFSSSEPIRSIVFPYSVTVVPAIVIRLLTLLHFKTSSYMLLILPRLLLCLFSFLQDHCIYQICVLMKTDYKSSLILFASSYVTFTYFTRTFSNSLESALFALVLFFSFKSSKLLQKVIFDENFEFICNKKCILSKFTFYSFVNSVILVWGCFIRPTFICFAMFPMSIWCFILYKVSRCAKINIFLSILLGASSTTVCLIVIDTFYYNHMHYSTIKNFNLVCTPINFIIYNLNPINLSSHGLHPRWLHALINVPLLFSIYGVILLFYIIVRFHDLFYESYNNFKILLILSFTGPLFFLSLVPHQEPRFIIPLIIPLSLLYSFKYIRTFLSNKFCVCIWVSSNIFCLLFYGFIHQAGVYLSINYLNNIIENKDVVIYYKNYMPPRYLFHLNRNLRTCNIYDLTEFKADEIQLRIQYVITSNKPLRVFIVFPHSISSDFNFETLSMPSYKIMKKVSLFPHLSTENFPNFSYLSHIVQKNSSFADKLHAIQEIFSIDIINFQKDFS